MEAAVFVLDFVLALMANVVAAARAGVTEDVHWSRQQVLAFHGVRLGLPDGERAAERPARFAPPHASGRLPAPVTLPDPEPHGLRSWPHTAHGSSFLTSTRSAVSARAWEGER